MGEANSQPKNGQGTRLLFTARQGNMSRRQEGKVLVYILFSVAAADQFTNEPLFFLLPRREKTHRDAGIRLDPTLYSQKDVDRVRNQKSCMK